MCQNVRKRIKYLYEENPEEIYSCRYWEEARLTKGRRKENRFVWATDTRKIPKPNENMSFSGYHQIIKEQFVNMISSNLDDTSYYPHGLTCLHPESIIILHILHFQQLNKLDPF